MLSTNNFLLHFPFPEGTQHSDNIFLIIILFKNHNLMILFIKNKLLHKDYIKLLSF